MYFLNNLFLKNPQSVLHPLTLDIIDRQGKKIRSRIHFYSALLKCNISVAENALLVYGETDMM